jgi:uncharacterized protein YbjT (DUF2867 family)
MIVVAGGTGRLGTLVVSRLVSSGHEVRVLTRDPVRANHLDQGAVEIVQGDVRDRGSLERAMQGATTAVSAVHGFAGPGRVTPASVDRDGNANLVDVAEAAGADVVMMSVVGASSASPMELFRAKDAAEQHLRSSRVGWTIVRATAFVELWAEIMAKAPVFGRGENPINFVSVRDVAAVVERAVVDIDLRGKIIEVGGPSNMTFNQLAELLEELRDGHHKIRHVPRWLLQAIAPVARQPRAALAMDTINMTFDAAASRADIVDIPMTDLRTAVSHAVGTPQPNG